MTQVPLTKEQIELRLDQIHAAFKKIEVLAAMGHKANVSVIATEASDGQWQAATLLKDLCKETPPQMTHLNLLRNS